MEEEYRMPLTQHLEELRRRLIISILGVLVGFLATYAFAEEVFEFLARPLIANLPEEGNLAILRVTEGFFTYLKVALFSGIILASPLILYQTWAFVSPGLYKKEKRTLVPFVFFSIILFAIGISFAYLIVFPFGFKFLLRYATGDIQASLSIQWYVTFAMRLLLAFGVIFQMPLAMFFLARLGLVNDRMLRKNRKYALLMAFLIGAVLTPPDVFTQTLMAGPLILLFEISIWLARIAQKKRQEEIDGEALQAEEGAVQAADEPPPPEKDADGEDESGPETGPDDTQSPAG
jgi:sec-independent protein translocase protein TatC